MLERWVDLAMVAHELGGALAPTRNAIQLLRGGGMTTPPEQARLLAIAGRGLERAERVLQNLSSIALLQETDLRLEPTPLHELLHRLADEQRLEARARGIALRLHVEPGVGAVPLAPFAFEQVLSNLLANALKFTGNEGEVHVHAGPAQGTVLPGRMMLLAGGFGFKPAFVKVRVTDTGVGISPESRRRLFQPFSRGEEASGIPGMGLGLAVSLRLAKRMGGDLRAEAPARGASFVLTLPADMRTAVLVERLDRAVQELDGRLAVGTCSVAVVRHELGRLSMGQPLEDMLRRRLGDAQCRVAPLSETTCVVWSGVAIRHFAPGLAAALRLVHGHPQAAGLRLSLRRAARGAVADPLLLQAAVRCRHTVSSVSRQREVSYGQHPGR